MTEGYAFENQKRARKTENLYREANGGFPHISASNMPIMIGVIIYLMSKGIVKPHNTKPQDKSKKHQDWIFIYFYASGKMKSHDNLNDEDLMGDKLQFSYELKFSYKTNNEEDTEERVYHEVHHKDLKLRDLFYIILYNTKKPFDFQYEELLQDLEYKTLLNIINQVTPAWILGVCTGNFSPKNSIGNKEEQQEFTPNEDKKKLFEDCEFPCKKRQDYETFLANAYDLKNEYLSRAAWLTNVIVATQIEKTYYENFKKPELDKQLDKDFVQGILNTKEEVVVARAVSRRQAKKNTATPQKTKFVNKKVPIQKYGCENKMLEIMGFTMDEYEDFLLDDLDTRFDYNVLEFDKEGLFLNYLRQVQATDLQKTFIKFNAVNGLANASNNETANPTEMEQAAELPDQETPDQDEDDGDLKPAAKKKETTSQIESSQHSLPDDSNTFTQVLSGNEEDDIEMSQETNLDQDNIPLATLKDFHSTDDESKDDNDSSKKRAKGKGRGKRARSKSSSKESPSKKKSNKNDKDEINKKRLEKELHTINSM